MAIKVGDRLPAVTLKRLGSEGMEEVDTGTLFAGRKVVLFAVPGAFTPTCSAKHLPGFVEHAEDFKAKGVAEIVCMAVNDPFVMKAWGEQAGVSGKVSMLPDGSGVFTEALGLTLDARGHGLGMRSQRFAIVAEDGVVKALHVDPPGTFEKTSAETVLGAV
jgi:glutaredoxin/glutathione-dependent peroxiredoxin